MVALKSRFTVDPIMRVATKTKKTHST